MERDEIDFGTLKVSVLFRKLFIPTLFGMLSISAVTVADGIFVGHGVGSDGIAAVNIYVPLLMLFQGVGLMIGIGCSVVASIHLSRAKVKAARLNVTQAMIVVTALTLLLSLLIVVFPDRTACLLGSSDRLLPLVKDYLLWFTPALVFQMWTAVGLFVIRLDGAPKLAMWCSVVAALLNVVLDWLFIFPLGWGVMGAAFATAISVSVGGVIVVVSVVFRTHAAFLPAQTQPQELALVAAQRRLPVPYRFVGPAGRGDAGDADVRRQPDFHTLSWRRRRRGVRHRLLLHSVRLHGRQRYRAVGAADH